MMLEAEGERPAVLHVPWFWDRLEAAAYKFLTLDYDGTLAPFRVARMEATPLEGIPDLLRQIEQRRDTALAVISGRPVSELVELLGQVRLTLVGSHGFEYRGPDGEVEVKTIMAEQEAGLLKAQEIPAIQGLGDRLEAKRASIALHTRGMPPDRAAQEETVVYREWETLAGEHHLEVRRFNGGVELRASGWNKGDAWESLLTGLPEETLCVYIGDDETDEDVFGRIRASGVGIRVGVPPGPSKALGFLPDIESVKALLKAWVHLAPGDAQGDLP